MCQVQSWNTFLHTLFLIFTIVLWPQLKHYICWGRRGVLWLCNLPWPPTWSKAELGFWEGPAGLRSNAPSTTPGYKVQDHCTSQHWLQRWACTQPHPCGNLTINHIFAYLKLPHGLYPKGFWARMEEQTRSRLGEKSRKMLKETKGWAISHSVTDVTNIRKLVQCARHHVGQKNRTVTVAQPRLPRCTGQWGSQKHKQVINSTVMREMQW